MLKICLVFWKSEPQYAYKRYAYKKTCTFDVVSIKVNVHRIFLTDYKIFCYFSVISLSDHSISKQC